ncbi:hypothetical protein KM043_002751 [Ampulex compressa]|nr:hypothetical protein KM043_002751 [Ampulex compressa]
MVATMFLRARAAAAAIRLAGYRGACFRISPRLRWLDVLCLDARCRLSVTVSSGGRLSHATTNHDAGFTAAASLADAPPHPPRALGRPVMAGKAASRPCANGAELARAPAPAPHLLAATTAATTATAATTTASPPPPPPPPPPSSPSSPLLLPTTRTPRAHGGAVGRSLKLHV